MKPAHKLQTFDQLVYMQRTDPFIKTIIQSVYTEHYHLLNENILHLYQVNFGYPMEILLTVLVAVSAFVATNLDDLFVLTLFFAGKDFNNTSVVVGQYIGVSLLMIISSLAYSFKFIIPTSYIALFGILPIVIGLKNLWNLKKNGSEGLSNETFSRKDQDTGDHIDSKISGDTILKVASVTFVNGGDNIGVYVPIFASAGILQLLLTNSIFMLMVGLWCFISFLMVKNRTIGYKLQRHGHILLPFVLILIGLGVLSGAGSIFSLKL